MRPELNQIENIERYLNNEMNAQQKTAFEQELTKNQALKEQVEHLKLVKKAVVRQALKSDIQKFAPKKGFNFTKWATIASAGIVLIALSYFLFNQPKSPALVEDHSEQQTEENQTEELTSQQNDEIAETTDTTSKNRFSTKSVNPTKNSRITATKSNRPEKFHGLQTWIEPDVQRFSVDTKIGAALEGLNGTLIVVPKDAFVDRAGNLIQGKVDIELLEALSMADMIAYNLTTTANEKALTSGGMIYVQPFVNGEKVNINPERPLYIEIPTDDYNPEMKSWRGVADEQGNINWENPQDLQKFLVRLDLNQLDFLPPNFENAVHARMPFRNHQSADKRLVDSLYYGLNAAKNDPINEVANEEKNFGVFTTHKKIRSDKRNDLGVEEAVSIPLELKLEAQPINSATKATSMNYCYINPLAIKTIKTEKFTNTFIATKEFEVRLRALHGIPQADSLLNLYLFNLGKNLWEVDALVASRLSGEDQTTFEDFASQKCSNLQDAEVHQELLSAYYSGKILDFERENQTANKRYQAMNQKALEEAQKEITKIRNEISKLHEEQRNNRISLDAIPQQINQSVSRNSTKDFVTPTVNNNVVSANNTYATPWYEGGWMNIDAYLKGIDKNSIDVEFVANVRPENMCNAKIYQCINTLKTLVPLRMSNNRALAKFPAKNSKDGRAMTNTYALGLQWTNEGNLLMAESKFNPYKTQEIALEWQEIEPKELKNRLQSMDYADNVLRNIKQQDHQIQEAARIREQMRAMNTELQKAKKELEEKQREIQEQAAFVEALKRVINSCLKNEVQSVVPPIPKVELKVDLQEQEFVEESALFQGGEIAMIAYIRDNFIMPNDDDTQGVSGTIYVGFVIETDGTISDVTIHRGLHPKLDEEALRLVSTMPRFAPAREKGVAVRQRMTIPIKINFR